MATSKLIDSNLLLRFWNGFKDKLHIHSNQDILDSITASYTTEEETKLNGVADGANNYVLPTATFSELGGVKIGSNITNTSGSISVTKSNITTALGYTPPATDTTYSTVTTAQDGLMSSSDYVSLGCTISDIDSLF